MNDHDLERIGRYFDGELSAAEAALMERRLNEDPAWRVALDDLERCRGAVRAHIEDSINAADFSSMWTGIEAQLTEAPAKAAATQQTPRNPAVGPWTRLRRWWSANWTPVVVSAAAAAIVAVWVTHATNEPESVDGSTRVGPMATGSKLVPGGGAGELVPVSSVVVDAVRNDGNSTVLISMPVEEGGATVIWLLEENEGNGEAGNNPPDSEEPI